MLSHWRSMTSRRGFLNHVGGQVCHCGGMTCSRREQRFGPYDFGTRACHRPEGYWLGLALVSRSRLASKSSEEMVRLERIVSNRHQRQGVDASRQ